MKAHRRGRALARGNAVCFPCIEIPHEKGPFWLSRESLCDACKAGRFTIGGMTQGDYNAYRRQAWIRVVPSGPRVEIEEIDLEKVYTYQSLESIMMNLAKYEGVTLDIIGQSVEGRNIYSITIDLGDNPDKQTILLTGQTHAREFAGSVFILKQYSEMIEKAQTDAYIRSILGHIRYVAIPVVNPDGREYAITQKSRSIKSNINRVDINRNFPFGGQRLAGKRMSRTMRTSPSLYGYYGGETLGSEPETRAVMLWLAYYIVTPRFHTIMLFDMHMQGRILYSDKPWDIEQKEDRTTELVRYLRQHVCKGYRDGYEPFPYGLRGEGGTLTDYATALAMGLRFSRKYGILTAVTRHGEAVPLVEFVDFDRHRELYCPANSYFTAVTIEIGAGRGMLGYSERARIGMNREWRTYNFHEFLLLVTKRALGDTKAEGSQEIAEFSGMP